MLKYYTIFSNHGACFAAKAVSFCKHYFYYDRHQSLPLPSLRWQQNRRISGTISHRNSICIFATSNRHGFGEPAAYKNELLVVERRRGEVELLLRSGYDKRTTNGEKRWLDRLEDVIEFYHQEGRLPEDAGCNEGTLEHWRYGYITSEMRNSI